MMNIFSTKLSKMTDTLLDCFFPRKCLNCGIFGSYCCAECLSGIKLLEKQGCPHCRRQNQTGRFCSEKCRRNFHFDQLILCLKYERAGLVGKLVKQFKYRFSEELAAVLGRILKFKLAEFSHILRMKGETLLVPVPLSRERLNYRGFNQALLLTEYLAAGFNGVPIYDCLIRQSGSLRQATSGRLERLKNLKNTIFCESGASQYLKNRVVIVVDDIATTGATLNECSRALKVAGAKYVCGLVLARG